MGRKGTRKGSESPHTTVSLRETIALLELCWVTRWVTLAGQQLALLLTTSEYQVSHELEAELASTIFCEATFSGGLLLPPWEQGCIGNQTEKLSLSNIAARGNRNKYLFCFPQKLLFFLARLQLCWSLKPSYTWWENTSLTPHPIHSIGTSSGSMGNWGQEPLWELTPVAAKEEVE